MSKFGIKFPIKDEAEITNSSEQKAKGAIMKTFQNINRFSLNRVRRMGAIALMITGLLIVTLSPAVAQEPFATVADGAAPQWTSFGGGTVDADRASIDHLLTVDKGGNGGMFRGTCTIIPWLCDPD